MNIKKQIVSSDMKSLETKTIENKIIKNITNMVCIQNEAYILYKPEQIHECKRCLRTNICR